uniref:Uncharacterized protein n=1 Tax=Archaeoglobus fulgidus TaxID=2234 RepID=A0A7J2TKK6_ARCFL
MIILHLRNCCIETAARKKYERLVSELLNEESEEKEKELEFLLEFLKKADFPELRRMGFDGREEMVIIVRKEGEKFLVEKLCST